MTLVGGPPGGDGSLEGVSTTHPLVQLSLLLNRQGVKKLHSKTPATQTVPEAVPPHQGGLKVSDVMSPDTALLHEADSVKCSLPEVRKVSEESVLCSFGF